MKDFIEKYKKMMTILQDGTKVKEAFLKKNENLKDLKIISLEINGLYASIFYEYKPDIHTKTSKKDNINIIELVDYMNI